MKTQSLRTLTSLFKKTALIALFFAANKISALQITGTGAPGTLPVFTSPTKIGNSQIIQSSNGNIGVGHATSVGTNPTAKLSVNGDFLVSSSGPKGAPYILHSSLYSSTTTPEYTWYGYTNTGMFHPYPGNIIGFTCAGTEAMRIGNGTKPYVGIGITAPTQMLHMNNGAILVQGTVPGVGGANVLIGGTPSSQPYGQYGIEYESAADVGYTYGGLNFWKPWLSTGVNTNNILFLNDNGKVGVNTANPTAQLTVNGKTVIGDPATVTMPGNYNLYVQNGILTEKLRVGLVNTADWADYVFAADYKLRSLSDVETFVNANKHLPEVPSACEVVEKGVDMVEMDAALLKKIEELTLYTIKQEKQIAEQNKRLQRLEKKLEQK